MNDFKKLGHFSLSSPKGYRLFDRFAFGGGGAAETGAGKIEREKAGKTEAEAEEKTESGNETEREGGKDKNFIILQMKF